MTQSAEVVRRMYEAIEGGQIEAFVELLDPRIVWTVPGSHPLAGTFDGVPELLTHLAEVAQRTDGSVLVDVVDIATGQHYTAAVVNVEMTVDGTTVDDRQVHLFEVRDGRIVSVLEFHGDETLFDDLFGDP